MHFAKDNPFLLVYMKTAAETYRHGLRSGTDMGPSCMHRAAQVFLGYENQPSKPISSTKFCFTI